MIRGLTGCGQPYWRAHIAVMSSILVTMIGAAYGTDAWAQLLRPSSAVMTEKDAYITLPPELIAGPFLEHVSVAPQGRSVAVVRMSMRLKQENLPSAANPRPDMPPQEQE